VATFREGNVFAGAVELRGPGADWAQANSETLGAAVVTLFERSKLEFVTEVREDDGHVQIDFSTANLFDQIEALDR
jgi:hypothetical protein